LWAFTSDSEEELPLHSRVQEVEMTPDGEVGPITLRLEHQGTLPVEVFQDGKPVAGVGVDAYGPDGWVDGGESDEAGGLELKVPPGMERLVLVAKPDEGAFLAREVRTDRGAVRLDVASSEGVLDLTLPMPEERLNLMGQALE